MSIALGIGGFQPRAPDSVIHSGFGDCKDKATLFVAALRLLGIEAYPVLLNAGGCVDRALPTIGQFDHAIAAIKQGSSYEYTDLTSSVTPLGELPLPDEAEFGLIVHTDGRTEQVTLPSAGPTPSLAETSIVGTLAPDGTFDGHVALRTTGTAAEAMRGLMSRPLDSTQRAALARGMAQAIFPGAEADSLVTFDGKDLSADARISLHVKNGRASTSSGTTDLLTVPLSNTGAAKIATQLEAATGPRRYPINGNGVLGRGSSVDEVRITLPSGWHARLPESITATSRFGTYESTYSQDGNVLTLHRHYASGSGVSPAWRHGELEVWLSRVAKDHPAVILLDH